MSKDLEVLTVDEVARILKLSTFTIREHLKSGKIRGIKAGRQWRVLRSDLEAYLRNAS